MRGIPGSGKTTYANHEFSEGIILSADDWFMKAGVYQYDAVQVASAHANCRHRFLLAMGQSDTLIVVDNTSINAWEIEQYLLSAKTHGYDVEIITMFCPVPLAVRRNIHGVPERVIRRMEHFRKEQQRRFPETWNHRIVHSIAEFLPRALSG
ncbi:MAG: ATP-binding protein [bacterium]|nr:ATP-binding protein [bacterium]